MSSSKDQIDLPCLDLDAQITVAPDASSNQTHEHLPAQVLDIRISFDSLALFVPYQNPKTLSSSKDQIHLPCPDLPAQLTVLPDAPSIQKRKRLPAQLFEIGSSKPKSIRIWLNGSQKPSSTFNFMDLAGELRNKIYAEALASGNISILLLSKKVYAEAKPLIFEFGVLKLGRDELYFGENSADLPTRIEGISPMPSEEELPLIQNVNIDIERSLIYRSYLNDSKLFWYPWALAAQEPTIMDTHVRGMMAPFMKSGSAASPRGTCEITLRNFDKLQRGKHLMNPLFIALKHFSNFQKVILVITADRTQGNWASWLERAWRLCMEELHGSLGPSTWHPEEQDFDDSNHSNGYLVFHPRGSGTKVEGDMVVG